jgi:hypothetical protein
LILSSKWAHCRGIKGKKNFSQAKAELLKKTIKKLVSENKEKNFLLLLNRKNDDRHATVLKLRYEFFVLKYE